MVHWLYSYLPDDCSSSRRAYSVVNWRNRETTCSTHVHTRLLCGTTYMPWLVTLQPRLERQPSFACPFSQVCARICNYSSCLSSFHLPSLARGKRLEASPTSAFSPLPSSNHLRRLSFFVSSLATRTCQKWWAPPSKLV